MLALGAASFPVRPACAQSPESAPAAAPGGRCEECHTAAAREVGASRHTSVESRCTGCHGGDPASFDERRAHLGKFLKVPLSACGACHEAEAEAFGRGPHGVASEAKAIRGCVECHSFHAVRKPDHGLFRTVCRTCHENTALELVEAGRALADELDRLSATLEGASATLDEAERRARIVRPERERLESVRLSLVELLPKQHAMDLEPFRSEVAALRATAESSLARARTLVEETRGRRRFAWLVAGLAAANGLAILWRRRSLPRPKGSP